MVSISSLAGLFLHMPGMFLFVFFRLFIVCLMIRDDHNLNRTELVQFSLVHILSELNHGSVQEFSSVQRFKLNRTEPVELSSVQRFNSYHCKYFIGNTSILLEFNYANHAIIKFWIINQSVNLQLFFDLF